MRRHRNLMRILGGLLVVAAFDAAPARPARTEAVAVTDPPLPGTVERRYRIVGKLHLALFSLGSDDVGSARISWRADEQGTTISLLAGSDPDHAPNRLNEWGYVREEIWPHGAEVFFLRRATPDEPPTREAVDKGERRFAAGCASITDQDVRSYATVVNAPGATYRTFDRLLEQLAGAPQKWDERRLSRPAGAQPGFLTALQTLLQASGATPDAPRAGPIAYVYNDKVYDLGVRRVRLLGRTTVGARTFDALTRGDLTVRSRLTGDVTKFAVTYVPDRGHVCLPVQIFFQPNFWVSVELRQDDLADAPADPAGDGPSLRYIKNICAAAAH